MSDDTLPPIEYDADYCIIKWPQYAICFSFNGIRERSFGLSAVLSVSSISSNGKAPVRWEKSNVNLDSSSSKADWVKSLSSKVERWNDLPINKLVWQRMVELSCSYASDLYAQGEPVVNIATVKPPAQTEYLIYPLLPLSVTSIIYGKGGAGKSWFATALALSLAGERTLPCGLTPKRRCAVLYLDWEIHVDEFARRCQWLSAGWGDAKTAPVYYRHCTRALADDMEAVRQIIRDKKIGLVIIDSLSMGTGGDLLSAADATAVLSALNSLTGVTRLAIAHITKSDAQKEEGISTPFGSVQFTNQGRNNWELTSDEQDPMTLALTQRKTNFKRIADPIVLQLTIDDETDPQWPVAGFAEGDIRKAPVVRAKQTAQYQISLFLGSKFTKATPSQLAEATGLEPDTVKKALTRSPRFIQIEPSRGKIEAVWGLKTHEN